MGGERLRPSGALGHRDGGGFDALAAHVPEDAVRAPVRVSADLDEHVDWLAEYASLGFDDLYLHHVGQDQTAFLDAFGEHVLPALRQAEA